MGSINTFEEKISNKYYNFNSKRRPQNVEVGNVKFMLDDE